MLTLHLCKSPLGDWQDKNWDPAVNSEGFDNFCTALGTPNNTSVAIADGVHVNSAVINYAEYINKVSHLNGMVTQSHTRTVDLRFEMQKPKYLRRRK